MSQGSEEPMYDFGYCAGINAEFGKWHRFIVGMRFGTQGINYETDTLNNTETQLSTQIGPSVLAGYKGTASFGLMWFISVGICDILNSESSDTSEAENVIGPAFDLGIGYKF